MRILVSGGGSAGHISPVLATLEALKAANPQVEILYVGMAGGMEAKVAAASGWQFAGITAGKFRRLHQARWWQHFQDIGILILNIRDFARAIVGWWQSLSIVRHFKPEVVFIKGGYVGLPVGLAAVCLRIPVVIHESDIHPGLTNRVLARWARKIAVGFPISKYPQWPADKLVHTGNPIKAEIARAHRLEGLAHFKLSDRWPVVLVTGGSQGAVALNEAVVEALPELTRHYQVLHLTGERDIEHVRSRVKQLKLEAAGRYQPHAFLAGDMGQALAAADMVVSRAGANTLAELALLAKPALVVPNQAMAGHQVANAQLLARSGAIRLLPEDRLTASSLVAEIKKILNSAEEQALLSRSIAKLAVTDSAAKLAELIAKEAV